MQFKKAHFARTKCTSEIFESDVSQVEVINFTIHTIHNKQLQYTIKNLLSTNFKTSKAAYSVCIYNQQLHHYYFLINLFGGRLLLHLFLTYLFFHFH